MKFQTFYALDNKANTHVEHLKAPSPVAPNLTLSLEEIFERWRRNEPLDIMLRNGQYDVDGNLSDSQADELLDTVDEVADITEVSPFPDFARSQSEHPNDDPATTSQDGQGDGTTSDSVATSEE